ncbi:hypothetical protein BKA70DRAFT_1223272 [Coprinopsis sp. MPI-PUGE-AT-0042]|nr:hypothetical protein BKA70DRAFT_1223272 [Coprinopsis sp. MPI-PUGE-AT-0042]
MLYQSLCPRYVKIGWLALSEGYLVSFCDILTSGVTVVTVYVPTILDNYVESAGEHVEQWLKDASGHLRPLSYPDHPELGQKERFAHTKRHWNSASAKLPIVLGGCKKGLRHDPRFIEKLRKKNQIPGSTRRHLPRGPPPYIAIAPAPVLFVIFV